MLGYASRTGTKRNLDALRGAGWGLLVCASIDGKRDHRDEGFADIMLDNGAWKLREVGETPSERLSAWRQDYERPFHDLINAFGVKARLIVLPDVVAGGDVSLEQSVSWIGRLCGAGETLLIPVQDGMRPEQVAEFVGKRVGIFVGGTTEWKWSSLRAWWGPLALEHGCWLHVGRAASGRMVERCGIAGAHSFDTSQPSRYQCKLAGLDNARRQVPLW